MKKFLIVAFLLVLGWSILKNPNTLSFAGPSVVTRIYKIHDALGLEDPVDEDRTFVEAFEDTATGAERVSQTLKRVSSSLGPTILDPYVWVSVIGLIAVIVGGYSVMQNGVGGTVGKLSDTANRGLRKANTSSVALLAGLLFLFFYIRSKGMFEAISSNSSWLLVVLALLALYAFRGAISAKTQKALMEILSWVGFLALIAFGIGALLTFLGNSTTALTSSLSQIPYLGPGASYLINLGGTVMQQGSGEQLMVMIGIAALAYGVLSVNWKPPKKDD